MAEEAERLMARPAQLVPVAVAAFEETWRSREFALPLLNVLASFAREEAEFRLREAPERAATDALTLAWGVVWPILEQLMEKHGYLKDTTADMLAEAGRHVAHVSEVSGEE